MDAILVYYFMKWFHPWAGILPENDETENFDGAEAVPNPEPQQILNAEAVADPGSNLTIASCSFPKIPEAEPLLQQDANPESFIEAANALNEVSVTYEPQDPQEVLELQQIPKIPQVEPLSQQEANPENHGAHNA